MSPRAASRLESIGFTRVYDYVAGKAGWGSAGLPLKGRNGSDTRAGAHIRTDIPTCRPSDRLHDVSQRLAQNGWETCFVVDDHNVVLGRLGRRAIRQPANLPAEQAMTAGPSTIRPSARLDKMVERMRRQQLTNLPVTTSDGRLLGLLLRDDAERAQARQIKQT